MAARMSALAPRVAARRAAGRASALVVRASSGQDYMKQLPGVSAPMGYFDPLGFTSSPAFTVSEAKRFREAEVTHGRVSMLAVLGWLVAEEYHPFFGGEIGGPAFRHFQARRLHRSRAARRSRARARPRRAPAPRAAAASWCHPAVAPRAGCVRPRRGALGVRGHACGATTAVGGTPVGRTVPSCH